MTILVCSRCSGQVIALDGHVPDGCPKCGATLDMSAEVTNALDQTGTAAETPEPPRMRSKIGRYAIVSLLGSGGCSTVYLAKDGKLDRLVAIKVPDAGTRHDPAAAERFAREGRTAAQLRHPGIVSIFNVEEDEGLVFIVSEYVEGEPLNVQIKKSRLSFRGVTSLLAAVAWAVEYAHSKGIIHRDIKPGNIMIDAAGNPRLMDFGLAKQLERDATVTIQQQVLGTPVYMSPEQARGNPQEVDERSDVYSLGATLYHLLTNQVPFYGEAGMVHDKVLHEEPMRPRLVDKRIPADLETICLKAMEKVPGQRYQRAGELAEDLERWLRGEPIVARHIGPLERSWRWCRRNPAPAGMIVTVMALLLVVAIGSSIIASLAAKGRAQEAEGRRQEAAARRAADKARIDVEAAFAANRELLSRAYVEKGSRHLRAPESSDDYNPIKALPWFYEAMKLDANNPSRLITDRIRLQTLLDFTPRVERMWFAKGRVRDAQMAPQGDKFFVLGMDGTVQIWRTATEGPPLVSLAGPPAIEVAAFSHDGKWLATGSPDGVRIWDADSGKLVKGPLVSRQPRPGTRALPSGQHTNSIAFSNSGRRLVTVSLEGNCQVWDIETGKPLGTVGLSNAAIVGFADSERLIVLFCKNDRAIHAYDVQTGNQRYVMGGKHESYKAATVDPNGEKIAGCGGSGKVVVCEAATGKLIQQFSVPVSSAYASVSAFSSDGRLLATGSVDGTVRMWNVREGGLLWECHLLSAAIRRLEFCADGTALAVINLESRLCIVASQSGQAISPPIGAFSQMKLARWADVSGRFVTVDVEGVARLWNVEQSVSALKLPVAHEIQLATVSADGRVLAAAEAPGTVYLLNVSTDPRIDAQRVEAVQVGNRNIDAIALSNDGSRLAISAEGEISVWETENQKRVASPLLRSGVAEQIRFTPNGALLVSVSTAGHATVWEVITGRRLYEPLSVGELLKDIDIDREGKHCAVATVRGVTIWELASGRRVREGIVASGPSTSVRFFNDGRKVLIAQLRKPTQLFDITTGQLFPALTNRSDAPCIALSDDRALFLTGYSDGTARLWNSDDVSPASPTFENSSAVQSAFLDPAERYLVTLTQDSHAVLWDAKTAELVASISIPFLWPTLSERARLAYPSVRLGIFSHDNRSLYLLSSGGLLVRFALDSDVHAPSDLEQEIALRSGEQPDGAGGLKALQLEEFRTRWHSMGRKSADSQPASSSIERIDFGQEAKAALSTTQVPVR